LKISLDVNDTAFTDSVDVDFHTIIKL